MGKSGSRSVNGSARGIGHKRAVRVWLLMVVALMALLVIPAVAAASASSGPLDAGTGTTPATGAGTAWANPGNITSVGSPYATCTLGGNGTSRTLSAGNYGFAIPASATIEGITVSINRTGTGNGSNGIYDTQVQLLKAGAVVSTNKAKSATRWPGTLTPAVYGSSSDLWGTTWDPEDFSASNFGVVLAVENGSNSQPRTATVDTIRVTVTYSIHLTMTGVTASTKTYDRSSSATLGFAGAELVGVLAADVDNVSYSTAGASGAFADANVGDGKTVTVFGVTLTGSAAAKYSLTQPTTVADITAKALTVTADDRAKIYGEADPEYTYTLDGFVSGEDAETAAVTGAPQITRGAGEDAGVYDFTLDVGTLDAANYSFTAGDPQGALTIEKAGLTVTAETDVKVYDGTRGSDVTPTITDGALVNGDAATLGQSFDDKMVGTTKAITPAITFDTGSADNYDITLTPVTDGEITPAPLSVTAIGDDKVYDGTTAAAVTLESADIIEGDAVTMHHTGAAFAGKNVGTAIAIAVDGITIGGADAANYDLQNPTAGTAADITPAALTVAAVGRDKVYDGTTTAVVDLKSGDVVTGDVVTAQYAGAAFAAKSAGQNVAIAVDGISVSGADAGNYALQNTTAAAAANITAKGLTITAADQSKQYGQVFAFTGGEFTAAGLVTGDTVDSVTLASTGADAAAVAGLYPIVASNAVGTGIGNYAVTYADGTMTVSGGAVVTPTYKFSAFAKPLRAKDMKKFRIGDKVLVKFTITDDSGAKVTTLAPQLKVTAKGFAFGPKTAKYNAKKKAYVYTLKIGKSWKLRGYTITTTLAGSTAKAKVKFKVVR
jgi:trimeric autotransporter adhesin